MKITQKIASAACILAAGLWVQGASAQTVSETTTTTTSAGTITTVNPDTIVVTSESAAPTTYSYTKTTTYVDEMGNPVSIQTVKSGLPVTVYYTKEGDRMIANKVIVRKATVVTPQEPVVEKTTTTSTTTTE